MSDTPVQPPVLGGAIPYLGVDGALKAAEFYKTALGAEVVAAHPPDEQGRTMHVHLYINGGSVMLSDFYPEQGHPKVAPQGFTVLLRVKDIEAWWARATAAGVKVCMPLQKMFWGSLYGSFTDPFGVAWAFEEPVT
jgi:uncharacterized glyoxalase superfamily protein PhnB